MPSKVEMSGVEKSGRPPKTNSTVAEISRDLSPFTIPSLADLTNLPVAEETTEATLAPPPMKAVSPVPRTRPITPQSETGQARNKNRTGPRFRKSFDAASKQKQQQRRTEIVANDPSLQLALTSILSETTSSNQNPLPHPNPQPIEKLADYQDKMPASSASISYQESQPIPPRPRERYHLMSKEPRGYQAEATTYPPPAHVCAQIA